MRTGKRVGLWQRVGIAIVLLLGSVAAALATNWRGASTEGALIARSMAGRPVRWIRAEILIGLVESPRVPSAAVLEAFTTSARAWNDALAGCGVPRIRVGLAGKTTSKPARDGMSTIFVRGRRWCPETTNEPDDCYDAGRAAITHLYPSDPPRRAYSEVYEADIEINAVSFRWALDGDDGGSRSLRAIAVHELGHALGLDHPCAAAPVPGTARRPCAPGDRHSVMYPAAVELGRRPVLVPTAAEVKTLCSNYRVRLSSREAESVP